MKLEKKHIIAGSIALVSITASLLYLQYRKLMNFTIKVKSIKMKAASANNVSFDLFLNFTNNSDLKFTISEQLYKVYLNDVFVTKLSNQNNVDITSKGTSIIPINVHFDPTTVLRGLKINALSMLSNPEKINFKVDIKLKVKIWGIKFSLPFVYGTNLKELMMPKKTE